MKKGDLKIDKNTVVHCPTEELANQVLKIAHKLGYRWRADNSFTDVTYWEFYKDNTCYELDKGCYSGIDFFKEEGNNIISAEEFIALHEGKSEAGTKNETEMEANKEDSSFTEGKDEPLLEKDRLNDDISKLEENLQQALEEINRLNDEILELRELNERNQAIIRLQQHQYKVLKQKYLERFEILRAHEKVSGLVITKR